MKKIADIIFLKVSAILVLDMIGVMSFFHGVSLFNRGNDVALISGLLFMVLIPVIAVYLNYRVIMFSKKESK